MAATGRRRAAHLLVGIVMLLTLSACGGLGRSERPAQVEDHAAASTTAEAEAGEGGEAQIAAYTPPAAPVIARPEPKRAVAVLMKRADSQRNSGDLDGAAVSLERAMRIAPDDAVLWHKLAGVRMVQRRHDLVVQLAAKSNALAMSGDTDLRRANWRLIADARRAMGDESGAREAERRARLL
jgi:hypothetical protein